MSAVWYRVLGYCCVLSMAVGCGDPPLHEVSGKVTLGGEPYERLLVYMNPMDGEINQFNKGVGETDAEGNLTLAAGASKPGDIGLAAGKYRVYFQCFVKKGNPIGLSDDKDEAGFERLEVKDIVAPPYNSPSESPVTFVVSSGENVFDFDIPVGPKQ